MQSESEVNIFAPARASNKLTLDSEQQERRQQQQRQRMEQIQRRKQQKRKKREEAERLELQKLKQQEEKQKKYDQPEMMFEEDSDDGIEFKRVLKKIKRMYPDHINKYELPSKKRNDFIVPDDEQSEEQESDSGSYDDNESSSESEIEQRQNKKEKKVQKKVEKNEKKPVEKKKLQPVKKEVKKQKIKVEGKETKKQHLVKQFSIRWWYALPEWPPVDYDYEGKLKQKGYRLLDSEKFKVEDNVVNGLQKVMAVDGYRGVYKSKTGLVDVRPKQSAPTLNNFRSKSTQELTEMLRKALTAQIDDLKMIKHQQRGEAQLLKTLQKLQSQLN